MKFIWWMDGKYIDSRDAVIPVTDLSIARGYGAFEFLRTYNKKTFYLDKHLERFENSVNFLKLKTKYTKKQLTGIIQTLIAKNTLAEYTIKILLTGGSSTDGITPDGNHIMVIMVNRVISYPVQYYNKGVKLITAKGLRIFAEAKSTNYIQATLEMIKAKNEEAIEVLYVNDSGVISECTRSNIFAVFRDKIYTPPVDILKGVTRDIVLKLISDNKLKIIEKQIKLTKLIQSDEIFITATTKEIMPVTIIDKKLINHGIVGPVTKLLMKSFKDHVSSVCI